MGETITPLVCSECGKGNYIEAAKGSAVFECVMCFHSLNIVFDVELDEYERLHVGPESGLLYVVTPV